jgi:chromosome segregation ATPase
VIGTEQAMADAIASVDEFGNGLGRRDPQGGGCERRGRPANRGLVRGYFDLQRAAGEVERAQAELNRVTEQYANQLTPLNAELAKIQDQKRAIQDQKRLRDLQTEINDGKTDDLTRQLICWRSRRSRSVQQIDSIEQQRDAAVDAQQEELDAAQAPKAG